MSYSPIYEISDLHFTRGDPSDLRNRFEEYQNLREVFYSQAMNPTHLTDTLELGSDEMRSVAEIQHFVGKLTLRKWLDPSVAVRGTSQRRTNPIVVAAYDNLDNLVGAAWGTDNVSSHFPSLIGDIDRYTKANYDIRKSRNYFWGSEFVHLPDRPDLAPILGLLLLEGVADQQRPGTWYPFTEEVNAKNELMNWGYYYTNVSRELKDDDGFGIGTRPTWMQTWKIDQVGSGVGNIIALPGIQSAVEHAHSSLAA
jgi:hypothetical protein